MGNSMVGVFHNARCFHRAQLKCHTHPSLTFLLCIRRGATPNLDSSMIGPKNCNSSKKLMLEGGHQYETSGQPTHPRVAARQNTQDANTAYCTTKKRGIYE
jgi:hypothetical protein